MLFRSAKPNRAQPYGFTATRHAALHFLLADSFLTEGRIGFPDLLTCRFCSTLWAVASGACPQTLGTAQATIWPTRFLAKVPAHASILSPRVDSIILCCEFTTVLPRSTTRLSAPPACSNGHSISRAIVARLVAHLPPNHRPQSGTQLPPSCASIHHSNLPPRPPT